MQIEIVETKHYDGHVLYAVRISNADRSLIIDCVNKLEAEQLQYQLKARVCKFSQSVTSIRVGVIDEIITMANEKADRLLDCPPRALGNRYAGLSLKAFIFDLIAIKEKGESES